MDFKSQHFFTGAAFPNEEDRNVGRGDIGKGTVQCAHGRARARNEVLVSALHTYR
jgi:hypothetical protein